MEIVSRAVSEFLSNTEVWLVRSSHVGDVLRVCVSGPESAVPSHERIGVVVATDAPWVAGTLVNTIRSCNVGGELPLLYAVSVGYPTDRRLSHAIQRTRDLTPSARPDFDPVYPLMLGSKDIVASGSAPAFLRFFKEELCPALEANFPIDPMAATLTGMSLGGLFALYCLLTNARCFRRYLAISPSLWWDERLLLRRAQEMVVAHGAPTADVYMCAGELESRQMLEAHFAKLPADVRAAIPDFMASADTHEDMLEMARTLSAWRGEGFRVCAQIYPEETHYSIGGAAFSRGLRTLYGSLPW